MGRTLNTEYPSSLESVRPARKAVEQFLRSCGCNDAETFDICIACNEAVVNAVEHGHVPGGSFRIECTVDGDVLLTVRDEGGGIRTKTWQRAFVKHAVGGYGLTLMQGLMDEVSLDINEDCGATVVMRKALRHSRRVAAPHASAQR